MFNLHDGVSAITSVYQKYQEAERDEFVIIQEATEHAQKQLVETMAAYMPAEQKVHVLQTSVAEYVEALIVQYGPNQSLQAAVETLHGKDVWEASLEKAESRGITSNIAHGVGVALGSLIVFMLKVFGQVIAYLAGKSAKAAKEAAKTTWQEVSDHIELGVYMGEAMSASGFWLSSSDARDIMDTMIEWGANFLNLRALEIVQDFVNRKPNDILSQYYPAHASKNEWWYSEQERLIVIFTEGQKTPPIKSLLKDWTLDDLKYLTDRSIALERQIQQYHGWLDTIHQWMYSPKGKAWMNEAEIEQLPPNEQSKRKDDIAMFNRLMRYIASWGQAALSFDYKYRSFEMQLVGKLRAMEASDEDQLKG